MKAILFREHGGPEKLLYEDAPEPNVGAQDALVKVKAAGMNHLDIFMREGIPGRPVPFPHISGCEGSGEVIEIGSSVTNVKPGDAVIITSSTSCRMCEFCLSNEDSLCLKYSMMGVHRPGAFAEYVSAPADTLYPLPSNLTPEEAASMPLVFLTAWHMLVSRAGIREGEDVLVHAAGSGVGIAAIQIAKLFGARVIATAGSDEKLRRAKALGADVGINYKERDFAAAIREITAKRGVDIIFEHTGEEMFEKNILSLARNGRLVTCGATSGYNAKLDLRHLFSRQLRLIGSYMGSKRDMNHVIRRITEGKLKPVVDSVFPLAEVRHAQEKMADRNIFGKIVIKV